MIRFRTSRGPSALLGLGVAVGVLAVLAPVAGACSSAGWANGINLTSGTTTIDLSSSLAHSLSAKGIIVTTSDGGASGDSLLALPVHDGLIYSQSGTGALSQGGTITFSDTANDKKVTFSDLKLDFLPSPGLTATSSSGARLNVFGVTLEQQPARFITFTSGSGDRRQIIYPRISLKLTSDAAASINASLQTKAVSAGEQVGRASVSGHGDVVNPTTA